MDRQDVIHILKPDKKRIAIFIFLIILINIIPIFPCQADREVMAITSSSFFPPATNFYNRSSVALESSYDIINNDFEWDDHYFNIEYLSIIEGRRIIQVDESISIHPVIFILCYISYLIIAYLASCWTVLSGTNYAESVYVRKKKEIEHRDPQSKIIWNCLDCGTPFPVMADLSGICPKCNRGYIDKTSWTHKSGENGEKVSMPFVALDIQQSAAHWDKYQSNLDETSNTVSKFKISYPKAIFTMAISFFLLIFGIIFVYSKVVYKEDKAFLEYSGYGIVVFWLICALSGFLIAKQIKNAWLTIPAVLFFITTAVYIGLVLGPILLDASHSYSFWGMYILQAFIGALFMVALAMASLSRYYYS